MRQNFPVGLGFLKRAEGQLHYRCQENLCHIICDNLVGAAHHQAATDDVILAPADTDRLAASAAMAMLSGQAPGTAQKDTIAASWPQIAKYTQSETWGLTPLTKGGIKYLMTAASICLTNGLYRPCKRQGIILAESCCSSQVCDVCLIRLCSCKPQSGP